MIRTRGRVAWGPIETKPITGEFQHHEQLLVDYQRGHSIGGNGLFLLGEQGQCLLPSVNHAWGRHRRRGRRILFAVQASMKPSWRFAGLWQPFFFVHHQCRMTEHGQAENRCHTDDLPREKRKRFWKRFTPEKSGKVGFNRWNSCNFRTLFALSRR